MRFIRIQADQLAAGAAAVGDAIEKLIATNARVAQDQSDYQRHFERHSTEHASLLEQHGTVLAEITDRQNRLNAYRHYQINVERLEADTVEFTPFLWHTLTDHAEVSTDGTITFVFRDGSAGSS